MSTTNRAEPHVIIVQCGRQWSYMSGLRTKKLLMLWFTAVGAYAKDVMVCCRKSLREAAERLADKYEDAKYRQEAIINRFTFL